MSVGVSIKQLAPTDGGIYRALMLRAYSEHDTAFTSTFEERATADRMVVETPVRSDHGQRWAHSTPPKPDRHRAS